MLTYATSRGAGQLVLSRLRTWERHTDGDGPGVAVERDCEYQELRFALAILTPRQREAIELAFWGGCNYPQVADHLDTPLGTIKSRIRDGLTRLRAELTPS